MFPKISALVLRPAPFVRPIKAASRKVVSDIYLINKAALRARNKGGNKVGQLRWANLIKKLKY